VIQKIYSEVFLVMPYFSKKKAKGPWEGKYVAESAKRRPPHEEYGRKHEDALPCPRAKTEIDHRVH
jgi:hypothetical protein